MRTGPSKSLGPLEYLLIIILVLCLCIILPVVLIIGGGLAVFRNIIEHSSLLLPYLFM